MPCLRSPARLRPQGVLDIVVLSRGHGRSDLAIHALKNNFEADAYFVKVIGECFTRTTRTRGRACVTLCQPSHPQASLTVPVPSRHRAGPGPARAPSAPACVCAPRGDCNGSCCSVRGPPGWF